MQHRKLIACLTLAAMLTATACATPGGGLGVGSARVGSNSTGWRPSIDSKGVDTVRYQRDLTECEAYAHADPATNSREATKKRAMKWGVGGAALVGAAAVLTAGAALPFILPAVAGNAALTGGAAAVTGGYAAKTEAEAKYRSIVSSCLQGRGYTVLG